MTDLNPVGTEEWDQLRSAVLAHNTAEIRELLTALKPYVMGWMSAPPSPNHIKVYLAALKDLGQLYHVYDGPGSAKDSGTAELAAEAARVRVLAELAELEARQAKGR
jgi:hypothetical protein